MTRLACRCWLFVWIVWRPWEVGYRLSWHCAWETACTIYD